MHEITNPEKGTFKLTMQIAKSYQRTDDDGVVRKYVGGIASGVGIDLDHERMAQSAIEAFQKAINEGVVLPNGTYTQIPLRSGHRREWDDVLGWVVKATIDDENNLWIEAELEDSAKAHDLYKKLTEGTKPGRPLQLGFSVGGKILKAKSEYDATLGKQIRVIENVRLTEVSVVSSPAYPTAYVEALEKSFDWETLEEVEKETEDMNDEMKKRLAAKLKEEGLIPDEVDTTKASEEETTEDDAEKAKRVIRENSSYTTTSTSETVIDDGNEGSNGEGDTIVLSAKEESDGHEEVSKNESESDTETDPSVAETLQALNATLQSMQATLSALTGGASESTTEESGESTDKSEKETEQTDVEKAAPTLTAEAVAEAVRKTIQDLKLTDVLEDLQALKSRMDTLENEEVDKSISVQKNKVDEELTPLEKFKQESAQISKSEDLIGAAVRLALGQK